MKKFSEKHEALITLLLIAVYLTANTLCLRMFKAASFETGMINSLLSVVLISLVLFLNKTKYYGLTKATKAKNCLYFIPLVLLATQNLWNGINLQFSTDEILLHTFTMINIGFIEEVLFRGFLFRMMEKSNLKVAIWVNALSFGLGHIINLLNGAALIPTLLQICYATAIGYLFVIIFHKTKSIIPCIVTHIVINVTSILSVEGVTYTYMTPMITALISAGYAIYINRHTKEDAR